MTHYKNQACWKPGDFISARGSDVDCPRCLELMKEKQAEILTHGWPDSLKFSTPSSVFVNAPTLEESGADATLSHKECIIADSILFRIRKYQLTDDFPQALDECISHYASFMQACHLRQLIGKAQREKCVADAAERFTEWKLKKMGKEAEESARKCNEESKAQ